MSHRSIGIATLAALAIAPAAASADLPQNLVTPDARDAGSPAFVLQDWRSPDARDAAEHRLPPDLPAAHVVSIPDQGFDWGAAAIGAAGTVGIVMVLGGAGVAVTRRRVGPTVTP